MPLDAHSAQFNQNRGPGGKVRPALPEYAHVQAAGPVHTVLHNINAGIPEQFPNRAAELTPQVEAAVFAYAAQHSCSLVAVSVSQGFDFPAPAQRTNGPVQDVILDRSGEETRLTIYGLHSFDERTQLEYILKRLEQLQFMKSLMTQLSTTDMLGTMEVLGNHLERQSAMLQQVQRLGRQIKGLSQKIEDSLENRAAVSSAEIKQSLRDITKQIGALQGLSAPSKMQDLLGAMLAQVKDLPRQLPILQKESPAAALRQGPASAVMARFETRPAFRAAVVPSRIIPRIAGAIRPDPRQAGNALRQTGHVFRSKGVAPQKIMRPLAPGIPIAAEVARKVSAAGLVKEAPPVAPERDGNAGRPLVSAEPRQTEMAAPESSPDAPARNLAAPPPDAGHAGEADPVAAQPGPAEGKGAEHPSTHAPIPDSTGERPEASSGAPTQNETIEPKAEQASAPTHIFSGPERQGQEPDKPHSGQPPEPSGHGGGAEQVADGKAAPSSRKADGAPPPDKTVAHDTNSGFKENITATTNKQSTANPTPEAHGAGCTCPICMPRKPNIAERVRTSVGNVVSTTLERVAQPGFIQSLRQPGEDLFHKAIEAVTNRAGFHSAAEEVAHGPGCTCPICMPRTPTVFHHVRTSLGLAKPATLEGAAQPGFFASLKAFNAGKTAFSRQPVSQPQVHGFG